MIAEFLLDFGLAVPGMLASAGICYFVLRETFKHKAHVRSTRGHRIALAFFTGLVSSGVFAVVMTLIIDFWWPGWLGILCFNTWIMYVAQGD